MRSPFRSAVTCVILALLCTPRLLRADEEEIALARARELYGTPVKNNPMTFAVNGKYFLTLTFDKGKLKILELIPKYEIDKELWNDDWTMGTNPYSLSLADFEEIGKNVDFIKWRGYLKEGLTLVPTSGIHIVLSRSDQAEQQVTQYIPWDEKLKKPKEAVVREVVVHYKL